MTTMITRRTLRRTHLLRPDRELNNLFLYCLAVLAPRHGILVHAATLMSTHEHLVVTDTRGELPLFLQQFHRIFALGVKVLRRWEGAVWDHEKTSVVELRTQEAIVEKIAYVIANPVAAGLVRRSSEWPGVTLQPHDLGTTTWTAKRPDFYFDEENPCWPEVASLSLSMPALGWPEDVARDEVACEIERLEREAAEQMKAKCWKFMGPRRIREQSPYDRATSSEPLRGRNPTFAVGRGQREAFLHAALLVREFRQSYRVALERWKTCIRDVLFPHGTWLMRCVHKAATALA